MTTALADGMAFELTKLRTLRSTSWSLATYLIGSLGLALLTGVYVARAGAGPVDAVAAGHSGLRLGVLALVVLGVLSVSSEFSTGTIHSSLTAVPRRGVFVASKLLSGGALAAAASLVVVVASFLVTQAALGSRYGVSLGDPGVLRSLVGGVLYATLLYVFAAGLAACLRSSALTIGILVPLLSMVSTVLSNLPGVRAVARFLPDVAGGQVLMGQPQPGQLGPWSGLAVLLAWTVVAVAAGYAAVLRRDA
jgi:ABC-2 type transport system permease protein